MTTAEILKAAREKVAAGWTQGENARDEDGNPVGAGAAACWCAYGAIDAATPREGLGYAEFYRVRSDAMLILRDAIGLPGTNRIADWNDAPGRTQAEVLAAFDRAIALAEAVHVP